MVQKLEYLTDGTHVQTLSYKHTLWHSKKYYQAHYLPASQLINDHKNIGQNRNHIIVINLLYMTFTILLGIVTQDTII